MKRKAARTPALIVRVSPEPVSGGFLARLIEPMVSDPARERTHGEAVDNLVASLTVAVVIDGPGVVSDPDARP
jgi:hypothetical protein